jgi:replication-associated recombination protein RarA
MSYPQPKLGQYDYYETVSALRKCIKLGMVEDSIYWANVILTESPSGQKIVAKQLWIMAAEDIFDEAVVMRAYAVYQMAGKVNETDHIFFLVARMARATKWWEEPLGVEVDYLWSKAVGMLKKCPKEIPTFALDLHTAKGAIAKKQGRAYDDRFSGTDAGRQKTKYLWDRDGRLDPDEYPDDHFFVYWEQYRELLGELDEPVQSQLVMEGNGE